MTDHYVERSYPAIADPYLVYRVYEVFREHGLEPKLGLVVSRSSTFTESREWIESMSRKRVLCVDVETSTLYTLIYLVGIPTCITLVVSDSLVKKRSFRNSEALRGTETHSRSLPRNHS